MRLIPLVLLALLTTGCTHGPFPVDVVVTDKTYLPPSSPPTSGGAVTYSPDEHWLLLRGTWRWVRKRRHELGTLERWYEVDASTWGVATVGDRLRFSLPADGRREGELLSDPTRAEVVLSEDGR